MLLLLVGGWGRAVLNNIVTGGKLSLEVYGLLNNVFVIKRNSFGLKSLCNKQRRCHILLRIDNTFAVASISKMGSLDSIHLDNLTKDIWNFSINKNIWMTAISISGIKTLRQMTNLG